MYPPTDPLGYGSSQSCLGRHSGYITCPVCVTIAKSFEYQPTIILVALPITKY